MHIAHLNAMRVLNAMPMARWVGNDFLLNYGHLPHFLYKFDDCLLDGHNFVDLVGHLDLDLLHLLDGLLVGFVNHDLGLDRFVDQPVGLFGGLYDLVHHDDVWHFVGDVFGNNVRDFHRVCGRFMDGLKDERVDLLQGGDGLHPRSVIGLGN